MEGVGIILRHGRIIHKNILRNLDESFSCIDFKDTVRDNIEFFVNIYYNTKSLAVVEGSIYENYLRNELVRLDLRQNLFDSFKNKLSQKDYELRKKELELKIKECELYVKENRA